MEDFIWRLPLGWGLRRVEADPSALTLVPWLAAPERLPWRLVRGIRRPRPGVALLTLAGGRTIRLPDRGAADEQQLSRLSELGAAAVDARPAPGEVVGLVKAWIQRHPGWTYVQYIGGPPHWLWLWRFVGYLVALALVSAGFLLCSASPDPWTGWFGSALGVLALYGCMPLPFVLGGLLVSATGLRKTDSQIHSLRVRPEGLVMRPVEGHLEEVPWSAVSVEPAPRSRFRVVTQSPIRLRSAALRADHPLIRLVREIDAIRRPRFSGLQAAPPSDAALSRLTGDGLPERARGISRVEPWAQDGTPQAAKTIPP